MPLGTGSADLGDGTCISAEDLRQRELVERAKTDPQAFALLYQANYSRILNYIYRRTLSIHVAEELTSNTFFKALRALHKLRHQASFRSWLYRIATNELKMHRRSEAKRRAAEKDPLWQRELERIRFSAETLKDAQERQERIRQCVRLRQCLAVLPERYETVLALRYFEGLRHDEIADVMGRRVGTVRSLVHRGLKRLKRVMDEQDATFS